MVSTHTYRGKFAMHGPAIEIACDVPEMEGQVRRLLDCFAVNGWPEGFAPTVGIIRPYNQTEVLLGYYGEWAKSGQPGAPKYRKIEGVGPVDEIRDRAFAALNS